MLTAVVASRSDTQTSDEVRLREVMPADGLPTVDSRSDELAAMALIVTPAQVVASWAIPALVAQKMVQQAGFRVALEDSDETVRFKLLAATWVGESQRSVQHFRQLAAPMQQVMAAALGVDESEHSDT